MSVLDGGRKLLGFLMEKGDLLKICSGQGFSLSLRGRIIKAVAYSGDS